LEMEKLLEGVVKDLLAKESEINEWDSPK
jgi:hypothetical protein